MRMRRKGLIQGYIKVPEYTKKGRKHLHILFRGEYISQMYAAIIWQEIHKAKIVDIRQVKFKGDPKRVASYMAKYMSKESAGRYSWSWGWVWKGFCKDWTRFISLFGYHQYLGDVATFAQLLEIWRFFLHHETSQPFHEYLDSLTPSREQWLEYRKYSFGF